MRFFLPLLAAAAASAASAAAPAPRPNIVVVLTDDLDAVLGSVDAALPKTVGLLGGNNGTTATRWFAHTPICCPSRAQILTGRYFHNLRTESPTDGGCMHINVSANADAPGYVFYSERYFARHFHNIGYTVGVFGKHLNSDNTLAAPPGVDRWFVNGGGDYYSPSFTGWGGRSPIRFKNCTDERPDGACYSTSVIGNVSLGWISDHVAKKPAQPFFAYIAVKAPHIQDGPGWPITEEAGWYNHTFPLATTRAPRTPNWNLTGLTDHHWLVRSQPGMTDLQVEKSDALYAHRLRSLLSVDDLVASLCDTLARLDVLDSTVIAFTSDHGFQSGQFGMPEGKWNAFENDLRVPFFIRGPGVAKGGTFAHPASHVDLMPTLLGLAGAPQTPAGMDGRSAAHLLAPGGYLGSAADDDASHRIKGPWRTELLIEYMGGHVERYAALEDSTNNTFRLLRVVDPAAPEGQRNMIYAEFTDLTNWAFDAPASEFELFDLDADPFQEKNIVGSADPELLKGLKARLAKASTCQGTTQCA